MFAFLIAFSTRHSLPKDSNNDFFIGNQLEFIGIYWLIIKPRLDELPDRSHLVPWDSVPVYCSYWQLPPAQPLPIKKGAGWPETINVCLPDASGSTRIDGLKRLCLLYSGVPGGRGLHNYCHDHFAWRSNRSVVLFCRKSLSHQSWQSIWFQASHSCKSILLTEWWITGPGDWSPLKVDVVPSRDDRYIKSKICSCSEGEISLWVSAAVAERTG